MLKGLAFRLGFILTMAVVLRAGAAILSFWSPPHSRESEMVAMKDRFGGTYMVPRALIAERGGEPVTSEKMRAAIERVRQRNGGTMSGAQLVFGSGYPNPVVTTPSELAQARADLREIERRMMEQTRLIDREESSERSERDDGVSFEPGKPMIDPTPKR